MKLCLFVMTAWALAGCSERPRSEKYFGSHLDEARQVVADCRKGSVDAEECGNADYAVKLADAEEKRDHFFMKDR